ncbi:MAG: glucosamine-6-phosphate deaminase [Acidimicrobiia bacterium]
MNVVVLSDAAEAAAHVTALLAACIRDRPDAVIGLAAGNTPRPVHAGLRAARPPLPVDRLHLVGLDEYAGLDADDPAAFRTQFRTELTEPLGIPAERLHTLDGAAADLDAECARFEAALRRLGGVHWQLLGIGRNGHIGFNEPGTAFDSRTRVVTLSETTRRDNAAAFAPARAVPGRALSQGIGTILEAATVVLLATGAAKAEAVAAAVAGPADEAVPASALQRHPDAAFVLDRDAAARL